MSGKPSHEGARKAIELLESIEALDMEINQLLAAQRRLNLAVEERAALDRRLAELLTGMDVESPGNAGWKGRFAWLLNEIRCQAYAKGASSK